MNMAADLIIFDVDGTITDTTQVDDFCFKKTFRKLYNLDLEEIDWTDFPNATDWGLTMGIIKQKYNIELSSNELRKVEKNFIEHLQEESSKHADRFKEIPGSVKFINTLIKLGFPVAIATGAWKQSAHLKLNKVNLDYKNIPLGTSTFHYSREEITNEAIRLAKEKYNINFKNFLYLGDGTWDYETTKKMGIPLLGVDYHKNGKLEKLGVKNIISDYTDVDQVMGIINKFF